MIDSLKLEIRGSYVPRTRNSWKRSWLLALTSSPCWPLTSPWRQAWALLPRLSICFLSCAMWHMGFSFLTRDWIHAPHRELGVITTRPPGSLKYFPFLTFYGEEVCMSACSAVSDSTWPQPVRFLCWWDFPGKNMERVCHFLLQQGREERLNIPQDLKRQNSFTHSHN